MPQVQHETQQAVMNPHPWAMYSKQQRPQATRRVSQTSPADAEIMQMAAWYAECEYGALAVESDSLDRTFTF